MHVGLIGGIGPAATDFYYRRLIACFAEGGAPLELTMVHADAPTLLGNLERDARAEQVEIYLGLTERLVAAGADCVVVTSIGGHFCIAEFAARSPLPVVNMLTEVAAAVADRGYKRLGILGTKTVMESRFYGGITTAEVVAPRALDAVHDAYAAMASAGAITEAQQEVFDAASRALLEGEKVEAIMLGGTDLALAYDAATAPFTLVDCAAIHVDAIIRRALG